jgi:putative hemolysin
MEETSPRQEELRVNVREIFRDKNPRMAKLLPGFIYRYIERIVHQDFINDFLQRHGEKRGLDFIHAIFNEFNVNLSINGDRNIPDTGKFIFASNHPLGGFDGVMLIDVVNRYLGNAKFLVNDILMNLSVLEDLFIPINKHGYQTRESALLLDEIFRSDLQILTFPSGMVSRKIKGIIQDLPWRKSFISKAVQYHRDIIPVHFSGRNSDFFYNLANVRKFLGIKWNLEMFFLVNESMKHRNANITVTFGERIPWSGLHKDKSYQEWANFIRAKVYSLPVIDETYSSNKK